MGVTFLVVKIIEPMLGPKSCVWIVARVDWQVYKTRFWVSVICRFLGNTQ